MRSKFEAKRIGSGRAARLTKSVVDRTASVGALVVLSPLFAVVAAAIKLDSPGPVFFLQNRVGRHGQVFRVVKFRSMVTDAENIGLGLRVSSTDSRITRTGAVLRRTSLDEIPQLLNVAHGEMSFIGPRPTLVDQVARYNERQRRRLEVKPGLTGWAQVTGRNSLSWSERIERDIWYVDHWSLFLDCLILLKTPLAVLKSEGLYGKDGVTSELEDD